ncbi:UNVERIFIED_CONTAM: hypothetical protein Sradi_1327100 [Sesamum radiatum]|uniref:Uncharacterized protein n=1 Tax=Sesamum radiatum TaxID=300843 RepID=A0AAW2UPI2_SESRA
MLEGSKPEDVKEWYEFAALASVHTMSPSFPEISKLPEWISGAVYDSWQNNPHLKRGDILELKFISAAPETAGKGSHPAFHFIKLQRPDMVAFSKIKIATGKLLWYQQSVRMIFLPEELGDYGGLSDTATKERTAGECLTGEAFTTATSETYSAPAKPFVTPPSVKVFLAGIRTCRSPLTVIDHCWVGW